MAEGRVSVIIPAYRCAATIGRAIDSVLSQTRKADEIVVVDDGSPEDLSEALAPYCEHIRVLRKTNGGASSARNAGISACTGDYVAFLDSDDMWHRDKLAKQMALFAKYPELGLVASRYVILSPDGTEEYYPRLSDAPWDTVLKLSGPVAFDLAMLMWTSSVVIRREVIGKDRFDEHLRIAEDRDLWMRLVQKAPVLLQSELMATLVERDGSLSRSDIDLDCRCMLTLISRYENLLGSAGVRRWQARVQRRWAAAYLGLGQSGKAIRPALRRLRYQPFSPEGWWVLGKSMALTCTPRRRVAILGAASAAL